MNFTLSWLELLCRAPDDCLQYYKGFYGNIQSFNFPNGQILSTQSYRICIRQELSKYPITKTS